MRALIAAIALVLVVSVAAPAGTEARRVERWGMIFETSMSLVSDCDGQGHCEPRSTAYAAGQMRFYLKSDRSRVRRFKSIRLTIMKVRPGMKWDKPIATRVWRNRLSQRSLEFWALRMEDFTPDCDPVGTRYYLKARIKKETGEPVLWIKALRSEKLALPWGGCPS